MSHTYIAVAVVALVALTACLTQQASEHKDAFHITDPNQITPLSCDAGEPVSFTFEVLADKPDITTLGLPPSLFYPQIAYSWHDPLRERNLRLDLCVFEEGDQTHVSLKRVINNKGLNDFMSNTTLINNVPSAEWNNLEEMLFGQDFSDVMIKVPYESVQQLPNGLRSESAAVFILGGLADGSGMYAYRGRITEDGVIPLYPQVFVGRPTFGDPLLGARCSVDEEYVSATVPLGSFSLSSESCHKRLTTGTVSYRFVSVQVARASEESHREIIHLDHPAAVEQAMQLQINHHNGCDSFILQAGTMTIAATSAGANVQGECEPPLDGAPVPDDGARHRLLYSITEGGSLTASGESSCYHFAKCLLL